MSLFREQCDEGAIGAFRCPPLAPWFLALAQQRVSRNAVGRARHAALVGGVRPLRWPVSCGAVVRQECGF
eukprot:3265125-Prymnesium_polylepis.1